MPDANWKRLGELLVRRRIELDPRYVNRRLFADERGLNYRTVSDAETGRRDNYEDATLASLEVAYALTAGSVRRAVDGGELEPLPAPPEFPPAPRNPFAHLMADEPEDDMAWVMFPDPADRHFRAIWRQPWSYEERERKAATLRRQIREALKPPGEESAGLPAPDGNDPDTDLNFL